MVAKLGSRHPFFGRKKTKKRVSKKKKKITAKSQRFRNEDNNGDFPVCVLF